MKENNQEEKNISVSEQNVEINDEKLSEIAAVFKLEQAQIEIEKLKQDHADLKDKLLRTLAEQENVKKRTDKQIEESAKYSISSFAKELLVVLDNLNRAVSSVPQEQMEENPIVKNFAIGIEMTKKEFLNALSKFQVVEIAPNQGDHFDHNFHQAVAHLEGNNVESGKIIELMQCGYKIHDRLLRPAMVSVAK